MMSTDAEPGTALTWSPSQAPLLVALPSVIITLPTWGQEELQAPGEKSKDADELR